MRKSSRSKARAATRIACGAARSADGITCNFHSVNRGKRSITLNLKNEQAQDILRRLVARSDVVIQSFLPETAEKLGISYDKLKAIKPDVIYCSINGYGEHGPLRDKPGYDLMMQAFSGIMSTTGVEDGPPIRSGVSFIDMSTGVVCLRRDLTALINRMQGAGGCWVRVSLLETAISLLGYHAVAWLENGLLPRKEGSGVWHLVPYQAFRCKDGYHAGRRHQRCSLAALLRGTRKAGAGARSALCRERQPPEAPGAAGVHAGRRSSRARRWRPGCRASMRKASRRRP